MKIYIKSRENEVTLDLSPCGDAPIILPENLKKIEPKNPENPYDELGALHNQVISELSRSGISEGDGESSLEVLIDIGKNFKPSKAIQKELAEFDPKSFLKEMKAKIIEGRTPAFPPIKYPSFFDDHLKNLYLEIGFGVRNFDPSVSSVHDIYQKLLDAEKRIMNQKDGGGKGKALTTVSVLRYSLALWHSEAVDSAESRQAPSGRPKRDPFKTIRRLTADIDAFIDVSDYVDPIMAIVYAGNVSYHTK